LHLFFVHIVLSVPKHFDRRMPCSSRNQRGRVKLKALLVEYCNVEEGRGGIVNFSPEPQCLHMAQMYSAEVA